VELKIFQYASSKALRACRPAECCSAMVELSSLHYDWPVGFARFEVTAMNATRAEYELDDGEPAELGSILGHPVTQILAHY
jgi:hypothetical protein